MPIGGSSFSVGVTGVTGNTDSPERVRTGAETDFCGPPWALTGFIFGVELKRRIWLAGYRALVTALLSLRKTGGARIADVSPLAIGNGRRASAGAALSTAGVDGVGP